MATQGFKTLILGCALSGGALATAMALGACTFAPSGVPINGDGSPDPIDAAVTDGTLPPDALLPDALPPDALLPDALLPDALLPDALLPCWTWTPAHFDPCDLPAPTGPLEVLSGRPVYNTDNRNFTSAGAPANPPSIVLSQANGPDAVIISVTGMTVSQFAGFRVEGSRPLIIAASGAVAIYGEVDVTSYVGMQAGAGANDAQCTAANPGENDGGGGAGGGGGGFQGKGGNGGPGDLNDDNIVDGPSAGGAGGAAVATPAAVRGGCRGGSGGRGGAGNPAPGGSGGGAVQLTSQVSISIPGKILAGGSGGPGAPTEKHGGSGGGSGGYIGVDAPQVILTATTTILAANGGGGGEGGTITVVGENGADGAPGNIASRGGYVATQTGGDGASGSAGTTLDGTTATDHKDGGGGGGGGAAGYIIIRTSTVQGSPYIISPPAIAQTVNP